ncbi:MAG TPA: copper resistance protein CopC [Gammaproteobacteria bacterium]|nr:copper resistance protein CopC [Gammaproteobacteria bacterium]
MRTRIVGTFRRRQDVIRRVAILLLAALLHLGVPLNAYAHQELLRSDPAKGDHLSEVPRTLRLVFNEAVELAVSRLLLAGPNGAVALSPLRLHPDSSTVLLADIAGSLESGTYAVTWQVVGSDGCDPDRAGRRHSVPRPA